MTVALVVFLLVGLLGGAHCIGMCGPLAATYAERFAEPGGGVSRRALRQHALFNAGRTAGYALVGAVFGALGLLVFDAFAVAAVGDTVRAVAGVLAGVAIVAVGLSRALGTGRTLPAAFPSVTDLSAFGTVYGALTARVDRWANGPGIVGLGALHALLPCPLLYPAYLYALAVGSPAEGALGLATLGLGTFPTMFLYGTVVQSVDARHRAVVYRALGVAFVALGAIPLGHGLALLGVPVPTVSVPIYQPLARSIAG